MPRNRKLDTRTVNKSGRTIWSIAVYIRLSREDGNDESNSVVNQRMIANEFLEHFEEDHSVYDYYVDDGVTGTTNDDRKEFQRMIRDMKDGKINCIICKGLSRMFRNYSDQGTYFEEVFPRYKTRIITLTAPRIDTEDDPSVIDGLEVPINGLMNDRFAAKTSCDVRRTFETKRRKGEFIGSFAPYGYKKNPEDKNKLVVDEEVAQVVRDIFSWFVSEGTSKMGIAKRLNSAGVLNPTAYKKSKGSKYYSPLAKNNDGFWNPKTVDVILHNQFYIGTMVQGKNKIISYKIHETVAIPEEEWVIVENTHEPIVDKTIFLQAQELLKRDMRTAPGNNKVYLLSGFVRCADCKKAMTRHSTRQGKYHYYFCRTYLEKSKAICTKHTIREDKLIVMTLAAIQKQIQLVAVMSETIEAINKAPVIQNDTSILLSGLNERKKELEKITHIIDSLYGDWKSGEISQEEYHRLKAKYQAQAQQLKELIIKIQTEYDKVVSGVQSNDPYLEAFLKYQNISELNRGILVDLVENILVHQNGEIEIQFKFADQHLRILEFIKNNQEVLHSPCSSQAS